MGKKKKKRTNLMGTTIKRPLIEYARLTREKRQKKRGKRGGKGRKEEVSQFPGLPEA